MRTRLAVLVALSLVTLVLGASERSRAQSRIAGEREDCVHASSTARFDGSGYTHWVTVDNTCSHPVTCTVSTDVAPTPVTVTLARGQHQDVRTFLSSPAREFTPTVSCR